MVIYQSTAGEYKGNLHLHTKNSDGALTPREAVERYEAAGYDFLAITDHRSLTSLPEYKGRMVLLPGIELDEERAFKEQIHLLGIGVKDSLMAALYPGLPSQEAIDLIHKHGGLCFLAHPHWSLNRQSTLQGLKGLDGAEIWNSVSQPPYNPHRAESTFLLDVLASEGSLLPTLANDDTHFYDRELFAGHLRLQADSLSPQALMEGLRRGSYYATQGPAFEQVTLEGDVVSVTCSPVSSVAFHSNLPWNEGRCQMGRGLTQASYVINRRRGETFVRVVLEDEQGRRAWLNPFAV